MKRGFLLFKFWSVLMVLGIFSTASLTGQTLMHSYTFEDGTFEGTTVYDQTGDLDGTLGGDMISIADGMCTVAGATANNHGWMSVDGTALALNTYSSITFESFLTAGDDENNNVFTMLGYFGSSTAGRNCFWYQPTRADGQTRSRAETNNNVTTITAEVDGIELDDGKMHHVVVVLTGTELSYYLDGALVAQVSTAGADFISTIGTDVANFFRGVDGWNDPNYNGSVDEFNIYDGVLDEATIMNRWVDYIGEEALNADLASLSANQGELSPAFDTNELDYDLLVPYGTTQVVLTAETAVSAASISMIKFSDKSNIEDGVVTFDENGEDVVLTVTAANGNTKTYTIYIIVDDGKADASLKDIELSVSAIDPVFNSAIKTYEAIVPLGTESVVVTGIPNYPEATVTGNGTVNITNGTGSVTINTESNDGSATDSYTVTFTEADGQNYALNLPGGDGQASNVDITGLNLTTLPYTIEMWFKSETNPQPDYAGLLMNGMDDVNGISYVGWQRDYDALRLNVLGAADGYAEATVTDEITDGWHHVAAIVTENSRTLILDGVEYTEADNFTPIDWTQEKTYIGAWDGYWSRTFSGLVDEVKIWNDSISPEILSANKYDALKGDETGLLAYYSFDLQNSSQAVNMAADAHHGLITGGTYEPSFIRANLELESLMIDDELISGFSSSLTEYGVTLPIGTESINVSATAVDGTAKISGVGTINVSDVSGTITITVTSADDLYSSDYLIHYTVDAGLSLMHSYTFADGTAKDVIGNAHGITNGGEFSNGMFTNTSDSSYITFPAEEIAINTYPSITMEVYIDTVGNNTGWSMLTYFGGLSGSNTYWTSIQNNDNDIKAVVDQNNGPSRAVNPQEASSGAPLHLVTSLTNDSISLYLNGVHIQTTSIDAGYYIGQLSNENGWLCYGGYNDPVWLGAIHEFNIYSGVMDAETVYAHSISWPTDAGSVDATLNTLTIDGEPLEGFHPANLVYNVAVEEGAALPQVDGTVNDVDNATRVIAQAEGVPGVATIVVTNGSVETTYTINFEIATGIGNGTNENVIKVYPTVSTGEFTVEMEGQSSMITVYDLAGRLVKQVKTNSQREIISLNQKGMYIVKVDSDGETKLFKVFKQ